MATGDPRPPNAFTLFEVLLVLAVLVVVSAMAAPLLFRALDGVRLTSAAERVRSQWSAARIRAMNSGETQAFLFEPGTGRYEIRRWERPEASSDVNSETSSTAILSEQAAELSEGVVFHSAERELDARSAGAVGATGVAADAPQSTDPPPILFFPDGVTSTARLLLVNERGRGIAVELRGLTGQSRLGESFQTDGVAR